MRGPLFHLLGEFVEKSSPRRTVHLEDLSWVGRVRAMMLEPHNARHIGPFPGQVCCEDHLLDGPST